MIVSTHVLNTAKGAPGSDIPVQLEVENKGNWIEVAKQKTDGDGRAFFEVENGKAGLYRFHFSLQNYFEKSEMSSCFPEATIIFEVKDPSEKWHIPLLTSGHSLTSYRGS